MVSGTTALAGTSHSVICSLEPSEFNLEYEWIVGGNVKQKSDVNTYKFNLVRAIDARDDYICTVNSSKGDTYQKNWTLTVRR